MKFLADENIPLLVVEQFQQDGVDIISQSTAPPGATDEDVLLRAMREKRILVTLDKDFGELIFKSQKKSSGVILLRIYPQSETYIYSLLRKLFILKINFYQAFCVVEPHRVRIIPLIIK